MSNCHFKFELGPANKVNLHLIRVALLLMLTVNFHIVQAAPKPLSKPVKLQVLILSGHGNHDWRTTADFLRELLIDTDRFDVRVCETPVSITSATLAPFDVVVDDYFGPRWGAAAEKALQTFVNAGKGLVITHAALPSFADWSGFAKMTKISFPASTSEGLVDPFQLFEIKTVATEHPVIRGIKVPLQTADQPLKGFTLLPGATVLAVTGPGEPLLITSSFGKGRVFCTALGHDLAAMHEKPFITTFLRGADWAASGQVTLPPVLGLPEPRPDSSRVLIINGGHDHEASFYSLFEGYKDIGWPAVTTSKLAFQNDLRSKFDVLVMYDFTRDLEEKEKKNLRDFVEARKGIVVLHHGILNYQKWPWWYEEVVGGRYRLERDGNIPNSTVKMGENHLITPVGNHPITAGIGAFHVIDETYKGLYISPKITPILTTDNPTSDRVVGWIGPCSSSRVVFIQLGHDHSPFRHPSYRALVHNSILWTAGKLN